MGLIRWSWLKSKDKSPTADRRQRQSEPPAAAVDDSHQMAINQFVARAFDQQGNLLKAPPPPPPQRRKRNAAVRSASSVSHTSHHTPNNGTDAVDFIRSAIENDGTNDVTNASAGHPNEPQRRSSDHHIPNIVITKKKKSRPQPPPNMDRTIVEDEVLQFERDHCGDALRLDSRQSIGRRSPPKNFFRDNLNPFPSVRPSSSGIPVSTPNDAAQQTTTKSQQQAQRQKCRGRVPPPKPLRLSATRSPLLKVLGCVKGNASSSCGSGASERGSGSVAVASDTKTSSCGSSQNVYNRIDLRSLMGALQPPVAVSSSADDDEEDEDAASGGSSSGICSGSDPQTEPQQPPAPRASLPSQQAQPGFVQHVNKYGDIVEYAVIDSEAKVVLPSPNASQRSNVSLPMLSGGAITQTPVRQTPTPAPRRLHVQVTDLDASMAGARTSTIHSSIASLVQRSCIANGSGCPELEILQSWSESMADRNRVHCDFVDKHQSRVASCKPRDIKSGRHMKFGTRLKTQLPFSNGTFKHTAVTVRKCNPRRSEAVRLVEVAIERDFNLLRSEIKHPGIVTLMAACYNKTMVNHMLLVLEPCDYTLNYFVHQMNGHISVPDAIAIVQQIAFAVQYLHEFGVIHSNISSHCVLLCKRYGQHISAKLSSFELNTALHTDVLRSAIERMYSPVPDDGVVVAPATKNDSQNNLELNGDTIVYSSLKPRHQHGAPSDKYRAKSKSSAPDNCSEMSDHSFVTIPDEYLPYNLLFRRHLVLYNYQAPELQLAAVGYVYPTVAADVYGLALMLWELLSQTVPYAGYAAEELRALWRRGERAQLPALSERQRCCRHFEDLFASGLEPDAAKRNGAISMAQLLQRLRSAGEQFDRLEASVLDNSEGTAAGCSSAGGGAAGGDGATTTTSNSSSSGTDGPPPPLPPPMQLPVDGQPHPSAVILPVQFALLAQSKQHPSTCSALNKSTSSSVFDGQLVAVQAEGRMSTLKKRRRKQQPMTGGKRITLFGGKDDDTTTTSNEGTDDERANVAVAAAAPAADDDGGLVKSKNESPLLGDKTANSLPTTPFQRSTRNVSGRSLLSADKSRFLYEMLESHLEVADEREPDTDGERASKSMCDMLDDAKQASTTRAAAGRRSRIRSAENTPQAANASGAGGYRFQIGSVKLPETPIARQNTIRRYTWLSEQPLRIEMNDYNEDDDDTDGDNADPTAAEPSSTTTTERHVAAAFSWREPSSRASINGTPDSAERKATELVRTIKVLSSEKPSATNPVSVNLRFLRRRTSPSPTMTTTTTSKKTLSAVQQEQQMQWSSAMDAEQNAERNILNGGAQPARPVPTRLSYTESMLRKDRPSQTSTTNSQAAKTAVETTVSAKHEPAKRRLPAVITTDDVTTEFNRLPTPCKEDNVTRDFATIFREMEALSRNNKPTASTNSKPKSATETTPIAAANSNDENPPEDVHCPGATRQTPIKQTIMQFENWLAINKTQSPIINNSNSTIAPRSAQQQRNISGPAVVMASSTPASTTTAQPDPTTTTVHKERQSQQPAGSTTATTRMIITRTIFTEESIVSTNRTDASTIPHNGDQPHDTKDAFETVTENTNERPNVSTVEPLRRRHLPRLPPTSDMRHSIGGDLVAAMRGARALVANEVVTEVAQKLCGDCSVIVSCDQRLKAAINCCCNRRSADVGRNSDYVRLPRASITTSRQTMRSMEDFYIDDDFANDNNGLAANIELVSDTSDLFYDLFDYKEGDE